MGFGDILSLSLYRNDASIMKDWIMLKYVIPVLLMAVVFLLGAILYGITWLIITVYNGLVALCLVLPGLIGFCLWGRTLKNRVE